jgi:ADP-dependent phosphofructokinase/glucokinase
MEDNIFTFKRTNIKAICRIWSQEIQELLNIKQEEALNNSLELI